MSELDILYGRQAVLECLRARRRTIHRLLAAGDAGRQGMPADILAAARAAGVRPVPTDKRTLDRLTHSGHHQGYALEASPYPYATLDEAEAAIPRGEPPFWLLLDHIQDPQNVGSLLRTADAVGVHGVLLPRDRAAAVTPAAVRASSGAAEHVRVVQVVNLVQTMRKLKEQRVWLYGLEGAPEYPLLTRQDVSGAIGLVVGSEGTGLGRLVRDTCDGLLRLPMRGAVASLNASVAAAVALYEIRRQRDLAPDAPTD